MANIKKLITKIKNKPEYIGILGIIITVIGNLVPNIYIANMPMSYIEGDGKLIVFSMVIVAILLYKKKAIASLIPTSLSGILFIRYLFNTTPIKATEVGLIKIATYGPGTYLIILGLCLCLAYGIFGSNRFIKKEPAKFNIKYFLISFILPIYGYYLTIVNKNKNQEIEENSLKGANIGMLVFLSVVLIYFLTV